jgi:hypothetical protein
MAADYIVVNRSKQLGNGLVRAADLFRELRELLDKLKDAGNHAFDGGNYTLFENIFGVAPGAGANTLFLLNLIDQIVNTNVAFVGDQRVALIEEFCARLAGQ